MTDENERERPVTVAQMIEALQKLPPDARLFVDGYEGGFCDPSIPEGDPVDMVLNVHGGFVYGPHESPEEVDLGRYDYEVAKGYVLFRN
jgi:hypothetical protein